MARARKTKSSSVKVNFKGVESRQTPPEGDYKLEVLEATSGQGPSGDNITFVLEVAEGKYKGTKLWFYCPLAENSLWKLHAFLTALGEEVPEDEMDIDLSDLVGKEIIGVLTHETYQGKKRAKMTDFTSVEDYEGDLASESEDEDDDKDEKPKGKKSKKSDKDEKPAKGKKSKKDEDAEEDQEEAPKSKKGKAAKDDKKPAKGKKKAKKVDKSDVKDMDEDELQELIDEHDLDVDLDDYKKLPKKVAAVIDALEENDLLEDDD